ncbi:hypothetical protein D3C72_2420120 [compost metagenome]
MAVALYDERTNTRATLTIAGVEARFTGGRINELATLLKNEADNLKLILNRSCNRSNIA